MDDNRRGCRVRIWIIGRAHLKKIKKLWLQLNVNIIANEVCTTRIGLELDLWYEHLAEIFLEKLKVSAIVNSFITFRSVTRAQELEVTGDKIAIIMLYPRRTTT